MGRPAGEGAEALWSRQGGKGEGRQGFEAQGGEIKFVLCATREWQGDEVYSVCCSMEMCVSVKRLLTKVDKVLKHPK